MQCPRWPLIGFHFIMSTWQKVYKFISIRLVEMFGNEHGE